MSHANPSASEPQVEEEVLGALLRLKDADAVRGLVREVTPETFSHPRHDETLTAIARCLAGDPDSPVDVSSVYTVLRDAGHPTDVRDWLMRIATASTPIVARIRQQIEWLTQRGRVRDHQVTLQRLSAKAAEPGASYDELIAEARTVLLADPSRGNQGVVSIADIGNDFYEVQRRFQERGGKPEMTTGSTLLDEMVGGCPPGEMHFVGGRPGTGKSVFVMDVLRAWMAHGHRGLFFSLEMTGLEVLQRLISALAEIPVRRLRQGNLNDEETRRQDLAMGQVVDWGDRLQIIDASLTIDQIEAEMARFKHENDRVGQLGGVIVDYIQRIPGRTGRDDEVAFLANVTKRLTDAAKRHRLFVLAAAQLKREDHRVPTLESFKGTGQIEQDAHVAIVLHRPAISDPECDRPDAVDFHVVKNRMVGGLGVIERSAALLQWSQFRDPQLAARDPRNKPAGWASPRY